MNILILGDIFGIPGVEAIKKNLPKIIKDKKINFVIANGENSADNGLGITKKNTEDFFDAGIDVITSGNHIWDQKETVDFIKNQKRLLRPLNLPKDSPGQGFGIYVAKNGYKVGVLNLMGNVFMKKCDDVFQSAINFLKKNQLKREYDFLLIDFHGEITSEKMAIGHFFDGKATLIVGTHTHVPTNDARVLSKGTAYLTDAGMCGDYNSVIGMNAQNSINRFLKKESTKHFPAKGEGTICGIIVEANPSTGLAEEAKSFIYGGELKNSN